MPPLRYCNWLAELGLPSLSNQLQTESAEDRARQVRIEDAVRSAIDRLPEEQRELVWLIYFDGLQVSEIARLSGRPLHRIVSLHRRTLTRLRHSLAPLVREEFGLQPDPTDCPICNSPACDTINSLIMSRDRTRTWSWVLRHVRHDHGLVSLSVQRLIGHSRYHMSTYEPKGGAE